MSTLDLYLTIPLFLLTWKSQLCMSELPAPENVKGTPMKSGGNFNITWTYNLTNIEGFTVYKNGRGTSEILSPSPYELQSQLIGGEIGVMVTISVSARNFTEESPRSREISLQALPHSPINVLVTRKSYDKALVQWTHGGEETTGFYIRMATHQGEKNVTGLLDPPADALSRQEYVIDVVAGNVYNLSVINQYQEWDSPDFNAVTYIARPSTPVSVRVTNQTLMELELSWTHGGGPVTWFVVEDSCNNHSFSDRHSPTNLNEEQRIVIQISPGYKHTLTVASEENDIASTKSAPTTVVIRPAAPQLIKVSSIDVGKISVQWTHSNGIFDSFKIELKDKDGNVNTSTVDAQPAVSATFVAEEVISVIPGQEYSVTVWAFSYDEPSDPSNTLSIIAEPRKASPTTSGPDEGDSKPSAPTSVSGSLDAKLGVIIVQWSHGGGAVRDFLVMYQYNGLTGNISHTPESNLSQPQSVQMDAEPGYEYTIWILSRNGLNQSAKSEDITVVTKPSVPLAVNVTKKRGQVLISWQPGEGGADKFVVFSSYGAEDTTVTVENDQTPPISTALTTTPGETYSVWIKAKTVGVLSDSSNVVQFTSDPSPPLSLTASSHVYSTMSVSWNHGRGKVDTVQVTIESILGTETKNYSTEAWQGSHTVDFAVQAGVRYTIWAEAVRNGISSKSDVVTFVAHPSQPVSIQVSSVDHGKVSINWEHGGGDVNEFVIELEGDDGLVNYSAPGAVNQSILIEVTPAASYTLRVMSRCRGVLSPRPEGYVFHKTLSMSFPQHTSTKLFRSMLSWSIRSPPDDGYYFAVDAINFYLQAICVNPEGEAEAPVQCYSCSGNSDDCGKDRKSGDGTDVCDIGETCWIRHETNNGLATFIRRCESTECTTDYQDRKCQTKGGTTTCSKCCTGDACNTGFVEGGAIAPVTKLSILIGCLITATSFVD